MTPTLKGRWQTRFFLLSTISALITFVFALHYNDLITPFILLIYVLGLGLLWDILYNYLQSYRWDHDWSPILFVFNGIVEGAVIWLIVKAKFIWELFDRQTPFGIAADLTFGQFLPHYTTVWLITFLIMLGPLKIMLPRWRFMGGEWI